MSKVRLPIFLLIGAVVAWLVWRWQRTLAEGESLTLPVTPPSAPTLTAPNVSAQRTSEPVPMRQQPPAAPTVSMPEVAPKAPVISMPEVAPALNDTTSDKSVPNGLVNLVAIQPEQTTSDSETSDTSAALPDAPTEDAQSTADGPLDLNDATLDELIALPGIGPALAQRIVDYRQEHGPFQSVGALVDIQGIGHNSIQEFEHLLSVRATASEDVHNTSNNSG